MSADLSAYAVTGTNNPNKQFSVDRWNALLGSIEDAVDAVVTETSTAASSAAIDAARAEDAATSAVASATNSLNARVTKNLYNPATNTVDKIVWTDGTLVDAAGNQASDFIPVSPSTTYSVQRFEPFVDHEGYLTNSSVPSIAQFDAAQAIIPGTRQDSPTWPITMEPNAAYVRLYGPGMQILTLLQEGATSDDTFTPYETYSAPSNVQSRKYEDLTVLILGDSISATQDAWWRELVGPLGFVNDPAYDVFYSPDPTMVSGRAISHRPDGVGANVDGIYDRRATYPLDRDVVITYAGTNDWGEPAGSTLGDMTSRDASTFYGAMHLLCAWLVANYTGKDIFFVTPAQRTNGYTYSAYDVDGVTPASGATVTGQRTNPNGHTLEQYVDAMIEVCGFYGLPVIDVFHYCPWRPFDLAEISENMADTVHPNTVGNIKLGRQVLKAIEAL